MGGDKPFPKPPLPPPHSVGEEIRPREALNFSEFLSGKLACVAGRLLAYSKRRSPNKRTGEKIFALNSKFKF